MINWQNHIPRMEKMLNIYKKNNPSDDSFSDDYIWMKLLDTLGSTVNQQNSVTTCVAVKPRIRKYHPAEDCYSGGIEWWKD